MADSSGSALQAMEATIQKTASMLSGRGGPNSPSKGFQLLVRAIGEAKTKHQGVVTQYPPVESSATGIKILII